MGLARVMGVSGACRRRGPCSPPEAALPAPYSLSPHPDFPPPSLSERLAQSLHSIWLQQAKAFPGWCPAASQFQNCGLDSSLIDSGL